MLFKKIIDSLKYIKVYDILSIFIFLLVIIPSLLFRVLNKIKKRKLLLIIEDGHTARDNGYYFYKYIKEYHTNDYCFYVIEKNSENYEKVKKYGSIIQYRSLKHWLYYMSANYNISNHKEGNPDAPLFYFIHVILGLYNNRVFLQHGITKDNAEWLYYKNCKFKYFICGAKREYEFIKDKFGYPDGSVVYTGFPRFDGLHENNIKKNQILIMPTWRNWLGRVTNHLGKNESFEETKFYKEWNSLLNDEKFIQYIQNNNITILFYPHIQMQKFLDKFTIKSKNIQILTPKTDIQTVLKTSSLMITDYSSVYMDFAYMKKPVIYFQFDYKEYREKQYQDGYYDYKKDGFGPVCENKNDVVKKFINIYENGIEKKYLMRMSNFFELKDKKNSERIYNLLK